MKAGGTVSPKFCDKATAAAYIGDGRRTLERKVANGEIPFYRVNARAVKFAFSDLDAYMARFRIDPTVRDAQ